MLALTKKEKSKIANIGKKFKLRFIVLHGSYALGNERSDSDLDIALVAEEVIPIEAFFDLYEEISGALEGHSIQDIDIKTLQHIDPFFRYLVVRDGILLYGEPTEYEEFKAYAFRDFMDTSDLRQLELKMIIKRQNLLDRRYSCAA